MKTSVSLQTSVWDQLQHYQNRSSVINKALELFFSREKALEKADQEYWDNIETSLRSGDGVYIALNPKSEEITEEILEQKLWN